MQIERWDGMPPAEAAPGSVWWHCTVMVPRTGPDGVPYEAPSGYLFDAPPDTTEGDLRAAPPRRMAVKG